MDQHEWKAFFIGEHYFTGKKSCSGQLPLAERGSRSMAQNAQYHHDHEGSMIAMGIEHRSSIRCISKIRQSVYDEVTANDLELNLPIV